MDQAQPEAEPARPGITLRRVLRGHTARIFRLAWSPDGRFIASASGDNSVRVFDAKTGELRAVLQGVFQEGAHRIAWSRDGDTLLVTDSWRVFLWDLKSGTLKTTISTGTVSSVASSPHVDEFAFVSSHNDIYTLSAGSGGITGKTKTYKYTVLAWSRSDVIAAALEPFGILLLDPATLKRQGPYMNTSERAFGIAWSPDNLLIALGTMRNGVEIWDANNGSLIQTLEAQNPFVSEVQFSADGRLLVAKSWDGEVRLWRTDSWETVAVIEDPNTRSPGAPGWGTGAAFHPEKGVLATLGEDDTAIRLWDLDESVLLGGREPASAPGGTNAAVPEHRRILERYADRPTVSFEKARELARRTAVLTGPRISVEIARNDWFVLWEQSGRPADWYDENAGEIIFHFDTLEHPDYNQAFDLHLLNPRWGALGWDWFHPIDFEELGDAGQTRALQLVLSEESTVYHVLYVRSLGDEYVLNGGLIAVMGEEVPATWQEVAEDDAKEFFEVRVPAQPFRREYDRALESYRERAG